MSTRRRARAFAPLLALCVAVVGCALDTTDPAVPATSEVTANSGGGSGTQGETVSVSKCYTNATATAGGQMLIKAQSTNSGARLFAYRPDGSPIGEVQNGGGSRYGGTVMPWQPYDPVNVTVRSSAGGSVTVPTTPFQI